MDREPGKKRMTSVEFASRLGVSQSTVSRALNDSPLVPEAKRAYIRRKARQMGFVLNTHARSLRTDRTGTIGILFQKHFKSMNDNLMLAHIYDRIQRELTKSDYDVMTIYDYQGGDDGRAFERIINNRKIDGLIVIRSELSDREAELIRKNRYACVSIFNVDTMHPGLPCCITDNDHGGYLAGRVLGQFPDHDILSLGMSEADDETDLRNQGFKRGLKECGVVIPKANFTDCSISIAAAYDFTVAILPRLRQRRTAIFAHNDLLALGVMDALKNAGVDVPGQVQVLGMDDIPMTTLLHPQLSTIHADLEAMVPDGCAILRRLIAGEKVADCHTLYRPRVVLRETTLPPPA